MGVASRLFLPGLREAALAEVIHLTAIVRRVAVRVREHVLRRLTEEPVVEAGLVHCQWLIKAEIVLANFMRLVVIPVRVTDK